MKQHFVINHILILDIGTTSIRGIMFDDTGKILCLSRKENHLVFHGDDVIEEEPWEFIDNIIAIIRDIGKQYEIDAIGITSQRSSIIPVDQNGNPLLATIMWQDTRNRQIVKTLRQYDNLLFQKTGAKASTIFSGSKMTWVKRNLPDIYERTHKFLNIPEFVVYHMTSAFVSDDTYASRTGLFDLRNKVWDREILKLYDVEERKLCKLVHPSQVAGYINEKFANKTKIKQGIPVIHCGGDQQCAAVGHGILEEGNLSLTIGTGAFLYAACNTLPPVLEEGLIYNCSSVVGEYVKEASVLCCGAAFDWCAKQLYSMKEIDHTFLEKELEKEGTMSRCLVLPNFLEHDGSDTNPFSRGVIANVTIATRKSEIYKGVMEGVFMEIANAAERFDCHGKILVGGGLIRSKELNQLQADIYGIPLEVTSNPEVTALGALMVALYGLGVFNGIHDAYEALGVCNKTIYKPNINKHLEYERKRKHMNENPNPPAMLGRIE